MGSVPGEFLYYTARSYNGLTFLRDGDYFGSKRI
jgi:hypothetical protein